MDTKKLEILTYGDGSLVLELGDNSIPGDSALAFECGAMSGDPDLTRQRDLMELIVKALKSYEG